MSSKFWIGAGLLAAVTSLAPWALTEGQRIEKKIVVLNGSGPHADIADKITIRDADSLAIGETRSYTSPSGKSFTLTRDAEEHWTLSGMGKEFGFGGAPEDLEVAGDGNRVVVNKRVVVMKAGGEPGEAEIHTLSGADSGDKRVEVFVDREGEGQPVVKRILINGQEADPAGENVKIIVKKAEDGEGQPHAIWIDKEGVRHEGLGEHGVMMIETEEIEGAGAPENATMVEIVRESGGGEEHRVEKRVFLFVASGEAN